MKTILLLILFSVARQSTVQEIGHFTKLKTGCTIAYFIVMFLEEKISAVDEKRKKNNAITRKYAADISVVTLY